MIINSKYSSITDKEIQNPSTQNFDLVTSCGLGFAIGYLGGDRLVYFCVLVDHRLVGRN